MIDIAGPTMITGDATVSGGPIAVETGQTLTLDDATLTNDTVTPVVGHPGYVAVSSGFTPVVISGFAPQVINVAGQVLGSSTDGSGHPDAVVYSGGASSAVVDDPSGVKTIAYQITDSGEVVGTYTDGSGVVHGFTDNAGSYTTLDDPSAGTAAGQGTEAFGINSAGEVVGDYIDAAGVEHGFLYSITIVGTTPTPIYATLDDPSAGTGVDHVTNAIAINNLGEVLGDYLDANGIENGFIYANGNFSTLDVPSAVSTTPIAINNLGQVIGTYTAGDTQYGFLYSDGTFITLNDPSAATPTTTPTTTPLAINDAGQVVGTYIGTDSQEHGFLYSNGSFTTINDSLDNSPAELLGINNAGQILGEDTGGSAGFIYTLPTTLQVDSPDTLTLNTTAISGGVIVDKGTIEAASGSSSIAGATITIAGTGTIDALGTLVLAADSPIANAGLLEATGGGELDVQSSAIDNTGTAIAGTGIVIGGSSSELLVDIANLQVTGSGTVTLDSGSQIYGNGSSGSPDTLENVDNTISGAGAIGAGNGDLALQNDSGGTIDATGNLILDTGATIENAGLIEATGASGVLDVQDSEITWTGSTPTAGSNGIVLAGTGDTLLVDVAAGGTLTLNGGGDVSMGVGSEITAASTLSTGAYVTLDNVNDTISGAGEIGSGDASFLLTNAGTIDANAAATLVIDNDSPATDNYAVNEIINSGTIEATGSGGLTIENTTIDNSTFDPNTGTGVDGHIEALAGSQIDLDNAAILQGFVSVAAGGKIETVSGTANEIETANGPTHNTNMATITTAGASAGNGAGILAVSDDSSLMLASPDAINNVGTIELNAAGNAAGDATTLYVDQGSAGIDGGGQITLSDSTENFISVTTAGDQLTNFDNTISGAGTIGGGGMLLVNNGIIDATGANPLVIDANGTNPMMPTQASLTNTDGILEATGGATLVIASPTVNDANGTITATGTGSVVQLAGTTITDGTIITSDGGAIEAKSGVDEISGVTNFTNDQLTVDSGATLTLDADVVSDGTITIDDGGTLDLVSTKVIGATITLISGGTLNVSGTSTIDTFNSVLSGNTTVEAGQKLVLEHEFVIGSISNQGTVEVAGPATFSGVTVTNAGGTITVDDTQTLTFDDSTINGGTIDDFSNTVGGDIDVTGTGLSEIAGTSGADADLNGNGAGTVTLDAGLTLDYVKLSGITIENGTTLTSGSLTVDGTVEVAGAVTLTDLTVTNNGTLQVDDGVTLTLDGTTINGGTINDYSSSLGGNIDVTGASKIAGSSLADANLNGNNAGTVTLDAGLTLDYVKLDGIAIETDPSLVALPTPVLETLTIADTVEVAGAATLQDLTVTNNGTLQVDDGVTLTLDGTTINGGTIDDYSSTLGGNILVSVASKIAGSSGAEADLNGNDAGTVTLDAGLTLDYVKLDGLSIENGTTLTSGPLTVDGTVEVAGAVTLTDLTVTNNGTLQVDDGVTLTLDGTTINGGTINDYSSTLGGNILVSVASEIAGSSLADADLNGNDAGTVTLDAGLTLDYVKLDGITIETDPTLVALTTPELQTLTLDGTVEVAGAVTLQDLTVTNAGMLTVQGTLTLDGATVSGGSITDDGTIAVTASGGEIESAVVNGGDLTASLGTLTLSATTLDGVTLAGSGFGNADTLTVDGTLTLAGATITGNTIDDYTTTTIDSGTVVVPSEIDVTASSEIESATVNSGSIVAAAALALSGVTLNDMTLSGSGLVTNDDTLTVDGTLTLAGATIAGNTIDDYTTTTIDSGTVVVPSEIDVTASSEIESATVNSGSIVAAAALALSGVTLNDMTLSGSGLVTNDDTLTVDGTLTLDGATIAGNTIDDYTTTTIDSGTVVVPSEIDVTASSEIESATVNSGSIVAAAALALSGVTLNDMTLSGSGLVTNDDTLTVDGTLTLAGATIAGNTIDDYTTTTIDSGTVVVPSEIDVTASSEIESATVNSGSIVAAAALALSGVTLNDMTLSGSGLVTNDDTLTVDGTLTLAGATIAGNTIDDYTTTTIDSGTVVVPSEIDVTASSEIESATVNSGSIVAAAALALSGVTLNDMTLSGSGLVTNDDTLTVDGTLTLAGATIAGNTIDDYTTTTIDSGTVVVPSEIDVTASSEIESATVNSGSIVAAAALALSGVTLNDMTLSGSGLVTNDDTLTVDGTLTLAGATIAGNTIDDYTTTTIDSGTVVVPSEIDVTASSEIESATVNSGSIVAAAALALSGVTLNDMTLSGSGLVTNDDTLTVDGTLTLAGATIAGNTIDDYTTTTIDSGTVVVPSEIDVTASSEIESATVNSGSIVAAAALALSGVTLNDMTLSGSGLVTNDDTLTVDGTLTLDGATVSGGIVNVYGDLDSTGTSALDDATITNSGTIEATSGTLTIDPGSLDNAGTLEATGGSTLDIDSAVDNSGTGSNGIVANDGTVDIDATVTDTGAASISNGGVLEFQSSVASGQTVTFDDATGTLALADPADFHATLTGLQIGDVIDLTESVSTGTWNGSTLTLNGAATAFTISGLSANDTFFFTGDGHSGTDLTVEAAPAVAISAIDGNDIINASDAAAGVAISGTASDSSIVLTGQSITVDILNGSNALAGTYTTTIANGSWTVDVTPTQAHALADGTYTVTANLTNAAVDPSPEASQTVAVDEDQTEQARLSVTVDGGSTTPIGASGASAVAFAVGGLASDDSGTLTFSDGHSSVVVTITDGQAVDGSGNPFSSVDLHTLADDTSITASLAVTDTAGNSFTASGNAVTLDQDLSESPSVVVDGGSTTPIGASGASAVAFAVGGLASDDSGTLTFSDGHSSVVVTISDGQAVDGSGNPLSSVDLHTLADDTSITASLAVTDTAGNSFTASGNAVTLDQDLSESPSVTVDGGSTTPIGQAGASAVTFAVGGLASDDSGTLTFSDGHSSVVVTISDGQAVDGSGNPLSSVDLHTLADDTSITASLAVTDTAGNSFTASGNAVTLDQDLSESPSVVVDGGSTTPIGASGASAVAFAVGGLASDDSGTLTFSDGHSSVVVTISDGQAVDGSGNPLSSVDLHTLADDTSITASLAVTDTAGNSFTASGNAVTLDQDLSESPSVTVDGGSTTPIGQAGASAVTLAVGGLASDDSGTLTFSDGHSSVVVTISDGQAVDGSGNPLSSVDLHTLADDTSITASLAVTDTAGNSFTASGNAVTVNGQPVIGDTAPSQTIGVGEAAAISGVSLSESGNTVGETFTVTLTDTYGDLSANTSVSGGGGTIAGTGTTDLTISGTLSQVNADLTTLTDTDPTAVSDTIDVSATDSLGNAATAQTIAVTDVLAVGVSTTAGTLGDQVGQILAALVTLDTNNVAVNYQWQISSNGGATWTDVSASTTGDFSNGTTAGTNQPLASFLQLSAADQGDLVRAVASFTNGSGQLVTATAAAATAVTDVTPEITVPFSYTLDNLSIVKNGSQTYNDTFSAAPPTSTASNGSPVEFITQGSTWTEGLNNQGQPAAILSSTNVAPSGPGGVNAGVNAFLNTNTAPQGTGTGESNSGLKKDGTFTVSATFDLPTSASALHGNLGVQLNDGTSTQVSDQIVSLVVTNVGGSVVVELLQQNNSNSTANTAEPADTATILASQTLTSAQLASDDQIAFSLAHTAGSTAIAGSFELLHNGVADPTTATTFATTGTIFTGDVTWTRADVFAGISPGVGLNVGPGQSLHQGQTLTASATTNDADAAIYYQWEESSSPSFTTVTDIGANSEGTENGAGVWTSTYTVQSPDIGDYIRVVATTSDPDNPQSATATSAVTGPALGPLLIAVPGAQTIGQNEATAIANVSLSENGAVSGETFAVTLTDTSGNLSASTSATGGGGTIAGAGTTDLVISGTLTQVNADLGTLTDTDATTGSDTITLRAADSFGNSAGQQTIAVTVTPAPPVISGPSVTGTASDFVTIDDSGTLHDYAVGINNSGVIVGSGAADPNNDIGWQYNGSFSTIAVSGNQDSDNSGINNLGEIAGFTSPIRSTPRYGYIDNNGTFTQLSLPPTYGSTTDNGINDSGVVVGNVYEHTVGSNTPEYTAFIANGGTITYLNAPGTLGGHGVTFANGINDAGQIVGAFTPDYTSTAYQGYIYQNGTFTAFSDPYAGTQAGQGTLANGLNNEGVIVGNYVDSSGHQNGFIYTGSLTTINSAAFTTIDDPLGAGGTEIYGINDAGQIVGSYTDSSGVQHGFVASLNGVSTLENSPLTLTSLSVSDTAAGSNPIQVTLDVSHGTLTLGTEAGVTEVGLGTGDVTLTGTQTAIDAALASGLTYTPASNFTFTDVLTITANDQGHNGSGVPEVTTQEVGIVVQPADLWTNSSGGNWSTAADWSSGVPGSQTYAVINEPVTVTISGAATFAEVVIDSGATLLIEGTTVDNTGTIALDGSAAAAATLLFYQAGATLSGGGVVSLSDNANNDIHGYDGNNDTLTNVDNTIQGAGSIDGGITLINEQHGIIDATGTNALIINLGSATVTNDGTLEATNPNALSQTGGLLIENTHVNGTGGGAILADGNNVDLENSDIIGGTLETSNGGVINVFSGGKSTLDGTSGAVTIHTGSTVEVDNNATLLLLGSIDNAGTLVLDGSTASATLLFYQSGATLNDGGVVSLSDNANNDIHGYDGNNDTLTNVDNTIQGAGSIDGGITLINEQHGIIDATGTNALIINLGSATVTNDGTLEATNPNALSQTGGLLIENTHVNGTGGGAIQADGNSVDLENSDIIGGTLETSNGGVINVFNGGKSTLDGTSGAVTIHTGSTVEVDNNATLLLLGSIDNTGTIALDSAAAAATLLFYQAGVTLSGGGVVSLSDNANNDIHGYDSNGDTLTNVDNTIQGAGSIDGGITLANEQQGIIDATGTNALVVNLGSATVTNDGTLEATNPNALSRTGGLLIENTHVNGTGGGAIQADGNNVDLQNTDIIGGTLGTSNGGVINVFSGGQSTLDGTSGAVTIHAGSTIEVDNNATLLLLGSIDNTGTIALDGSTASATLLFHQAGVTLSGGGVVSLSDNANNDIHGYDGNNDTLTNVDNTIQGAGSIDGGITLINEQHGIIDATGTNALIINLGSATVTNDGTLEATAGGTLDIDSSVNNSGTLEASGGTLVVASGVSITGTGAAVITAEGTANFQDAFDQNVMFGSGGGTLILAQPASFDASHVITSASGSFAANDVIDLVGYATTDHASAGSFNSAADTTPLTIYDSSNDVIQSFTLAGNQSGTSWTVASDAGNTGIDVYDPPAAIATIVNGASLDIAAASNEIVTFTGATGALILNDPASFTGQIVGFTGTAPDAAHSDTVDLVGIDYDSSGFADTYNSTTGLLTVTDGSHSASITFDDFNATLDFASDGHGGTVITDPPASGSSGSSGSSGATASAPADWGMKFGDDSIELAHGQWMNQADGANGANTPLVSLHDGNDTFVFHHDLGAETGAGLNPHAGAYELANHPDAHLAHQLTALVTPDPHEAFFDLIHNDILAPGGLTPTQILHSIHAGYLLH